MLFFIKIACIQTGTRRVLPRADQMVVHWVLRQSAMHRVDRGWKKIIFASYLVEKEIITFILVFAFKVLNYI